MSLNDILRHAELAIVYAGQIDDDNDEIRTNFPATITLWCCGDWQQCEAQYVDRCAPRYVCPVCGQWKVT
jgi:hypothetical protein